MVHCCVSPVVLQAPQCILSNNRPKDRLCLQNHSLAWCLCLQELGQVDGVCSFWEAAQALVASLAERLGLLAHSPSAVEAAREKQVSSAASPRLIMFRDKKSFPKWQNSLCKFALSSQLHETESFRLWLIPVFDRLQNTRSCMAKAGLPTPANYLIRSGNDIKKAAEIVGFPAVIKPISGAASEGVVRVDSLEILET